MMRLPRVMHVLSNLSMGGAELNTARLSAALAARGFEQLIVSLTPWVDPMFSSTIRVPLARPASRRSLVGALYLAQMAREFRPDLIHGRGFRTWAACVYAKCISGSGTRLVQSFHGPASFDLRRVRRTLASLALRRGTSVLLAVSEDLASRLTQQWKIAKSKVHVVHNGVDVQQFRPTGDREAAKTRLGIRARCFVVGTVGSLRPVKNHSLLLEAFAAHSRVGGDDCLLLVGDGPLRSVLEQQAQRLGMAKRVVFCGSQRVVSDYLAAMDVFVQPSLQEGSPTAVLEAMACGLPVVAVGSRGCVELNAQTGLPLLVDAQQASALAQQLTELAADEVRRRALGEEARSIIARRFTVEKMAASYERIYRSLIENGSLAVSLAAPGPAR